MSQIRKYLPVGSIVKVKKMEFPIMISGFCVTDVRNKDVLYDYTGCMYPIGIVDSNQSFLFQNNEIEKVIYYGYTSQEYREFNQRLLNIVDEHYDDLLPSDEDLEVI